MKLISVSNGVLGKGGQYSGINKCIMCFCSPQIKEHHWNLAKIFNLLKIDDVFATFENIVLTGALKILNEIFGLMEGNAKHPCLYCTVEQHIPAGQPRALASLRNNHERWKSTSGDIKTCKYYNNVKGKSRYLFSTWCWKTRDKSFVLLHPCKKNMFYTENIGAVFQKNSILRLP